MAYAFLLLLLPLLIIPNAPKKVPEVTPGIRAYCKDNMFSDKSWCVAYGFKPEGAWKRE